MRIIIYKLKSQKSKLKILGLGIAGIGLIAVLVYSRAGAQVVGPGQPIRFSYAAKFICGPQTQSQIKPTNPDLRNPQEPPVKLGNYATAVNIHNPQRSQTKILKKVVIARPEPDQGKPTEKVSDVLIPDGAMEVDCQEINNLLVRAQQIPPDDNNFRKGFLVIESSAELDVVAVYTANTDAASLTESSVSQPQGMTMDVEYIPVRRISVNPNVNPNL